MFERGGHQWEGKWGSGDGKDANTAAGGRPSRRLGEMYGISSVEKPVKRGTDQIRSLSYKYGTERKA
ncbi:MAG: hypothetical protein BAA03_14525 [Caldibacillus debilis]|nr:MAG: hypothetical protein BAA03_14525 [Caldibacillus debilis]